jgi:hypothetical protein
LMTGLGRAVQAARFQDTAQIAAKNIL